jgi:hypothetical protein
MIKNEVGSKVLFENDQLKIWDLQLAPGENQGMHVDKKDYVVVFIGDSRIRGVNQDGSTRFEQDMADGTVIHRVLDADEDVHDAVNVGEGRSRDLVIELKSSE